MSKWSTPGRQAQLVKLFLNSGGFCVFGHRPCPYPHHHYEEFIEGLIAEWKADDRQARLAEARAEARALHGLSERGPVKGRFSKVSRDIFFGRQPQFYLEGLGISGLTFRPFAKVRLASSFVNLHVDLGDSLRAVSKNRKRKALRYGKPLPKQAQETVGQLCGRAVRDFVK